MRGQRGARNDTSAWATDKTSIGARVSDFCSSNDAKMDDLAHGARNSAEREITEKGLEYCQELRL